MDADRPHDAPQHGASPAEPSRGRTADTARFGRNLPVAIASGVALAAVFFTTLFLSPLAFLAFIGVLSSIALLELDGAFRAHGLRPATPITIGLGWLLLFGAYLGGAPAQSLGLVLLVLGSLAWALLDPGRRERETSAEARGALGVGRITGNVGATCLMTLWVPFLASFVGLLLARDDGAWYVMAAVALAVTNDIGAFGFGSRFGRNKMAPSVSPGKSWEGFAGGVATVLLISALVTARVPGFDLTLALVFGLGVAIAATLGDLSESLVKRDLGVKDLGTIIPGHGGIMDRVDAIIFALPTAHLVLLALGA
jgi:phosphatidate cytidylyltransferase